MTKKSQQLFKSDADTGPVECLGTTFDTDLERRSHFTELLRQKLKEPEFRNTPGFPDGTDEDILALSDPPYYTACPNPFLPAFAEANATAYSHEEEYSVESFATDVKSGKGDKSYYIHSYHTKVPPSAIAQFIGHYARTGDLVLDCFSGSGMTAMGSTLVKDKPVAVVLVDLSIAASFISYFHSLFRPTSQQAKTVAGVFQLAKDEFADLYRTRHTGWPASHEAPSEEENSNPNGERIGTIRYTVWSDYVRCPECGEEMCLWDEVVTLSENKVEDDFNCSSCGVLLTKKVKGAKKKGAVVVTRSKETVFDEALNATVERVRRRPVLISYNVDRTRYEKYPDEDDLERIRLADTTTVSNWFPTNQIPAGDKTGDPRRAGITHVHQYFPRRTLHSLAFIADRLRSEPGCIGFVTSILTRCSWQNRYMPQHRGNRSREVVGPLSGTLYIPPFALEINPIEYGEQKANGIIRGLGRVPRANAIVSTESASRIRDSLREKIDYVFIDPPFGANLQYSELSFCMECWLRVITNATNEMVVNQSQHKDLIDYGRMMRSAFVSVFDSMKPGRWITIEFHNSQNAVWNVIQNAVSEAGLVVADCRVLDKVKGTTKQLTQANTVKQDLIITAYRPDSTFESSFQVQAGTEDAVWSFVRSHLGQLPVAVRKGDAVEVVAERQSHMLFDRMVAFHVQKGVAVPLSTAEFYEKLSQRFVERDRMYFLEEQVVPYDKMRMSANECMQLELFVTNEASAIQWLKQQLKLKPQTFQELQPQFMREVGGWEKHEKHLELSDLLEQNCLCYVNESDPVPSQIHAYLSSSYHDQRRLTKDDPILKAKAVNRWYVPDPRKEADLENVRNRALLREFEGYQSEKEALRVVRSEALRAGFKQCWKDGNYLQIIQLAERIKGEIVQEDPSLLMYYDNALMRSEG